MKKVKSTISLLKRLTFLNVNVARVKYNRMMNTIDLQVVLPDQVAEIKNGDKFVVFLTQKDLRSYLND